MKLVLWSVVLLAAFSVSAHAGGVLDSSVDADGNRGYSVSRHFRTAGAALAWLACCRDPRLLPTRGIR